MGSTQIHIRTSEFFNIQLHFPDISEQKKIACILSNIDNLIDSYDRIIDLTKRLKTGQMQQLLTKGIGHTKFKEVKWHLEKILLIPQNWKLKHLSEIADVIDPYPSHRAPPIDLNGIPYLGIGDFDENGKIVHVSRKVSKNVLAEQKETFQIKEGVLALGRVASIGKVVSLKTDVDFTVSPTLSIIVPKIDVNYLKFVLRSNYFQQQLNFNIKGSTRSSVGIQIVRKLSIFLPPQNEQKQISCILSNLDKKQKFLEKQKLCLKMIKIQLSENLLVGTLRV